LNITSTSANTFSQLPYAGAETIMTPQEALSSTSVITGPAPQSTNNHDALPINHQHQHHDHQLDLGTQSTGSSDVVMVETPAPMPTHTPAPMYTVQFVPQMPQVLVLGNNHASLFTPASAAAALPIPNINVLQTIPALNNLVPGSSKLFFGANGDFLLTCSNSQVLEVPMALLKAVLWYASELNNTRGHPEWHVQLVKPFGYHHLTHALNGDPLQPAKLPMIHSDSSITYTGAYPLHMNYPHPEHVQQAMQLIDLFGKDVNTRLINTIIMCVAGS
jgi:hypothetical protein